jgi:hypothetical protein
MASVLLGAVSDLKLPHSSYVATVFLGTGNNHPLFIWMVDDTAFFSCHMSIYILSSCVMKTSLYCCHLNIYVLPYKKKSPPVHKLIFLPAHSPLNGLSVLTVYGFLNSELT